jgi:ParB family transcriptional regulator, chromosome partitioning protein
MSKNDKPSWRKLIDAKIIKRTDNGMAVRPDAIRFVDGICANVRDYDDPDFRADQADLKAHLKRGGKVPALEVVLSADGQGVDVVDGHRRTMAYRELIAEGDPIEYIRIEPFEGNDLLRLVRIMTSNEGRKLKPLEVAEGYRRLESFGKSHEEIARYVGKTRQHVAQMLALTSAPDSVHKLVRDGLVSATTAIQEVQAHGPAKAAARLADKAATTGGRKITSKALKPWTPSAKAVAPVIAVLDELHAQLPAATRMDLLNEPREGATVTVPASFMYQLMQQHDAISQMREQAAEKARAKAAEQGELVAGA